MGQPIARCLQAAVAAVFLLLAFGFQPAAEAQNLPYGSYLLTCRNAQVQNGNLIASCRTNDGRMVQSMVPAKCNGEIANVNGQLKCNAGGFNNPPPSGSYQQTCNNIYMTGQVLHANCLKRNGQSNQASLNIANCRNDISNQDGLLMCGGGGQIPNGSYQQSCNGAYMSGFTLFARCRNNYGQMMSTQLNIQNCRQDIANINGQLVCQGQGGRGITVFAGVGWQGASRQIQGAVADLSTIGFGNSIQSVAISNSTWEFCTAPYFGGQCVRLNHGVANLRDFNLAFKIMSIRPVNY